MLFPSEEKIDLNMIDAEISYFPSFFDNECANNYFKKLKEEILWQQDTIKVFGKEHLQPRLTALYANNSKTYSYANITMHPHPFSPLLLKIKDKIEKASNAKFSTVLLNLYRDGKDSNGWHADNEPELGENPVIASLSLGEERIFHFKHKEQKELKHKLVLQHGSLLLMQGSTQHHWLHQIPKTSKQIGPRINLTFRFIP